MAHDPCPRRSGCLVHEVSFRAFVPGLASLYLNDDFIKEKEAKMHHRGERERERDLQGRLVTSQRPEPPCMPRPHQALSIRGGDMGYVWRMFDVSEGGKKGFVFGEAILMTEAAAPRCDRRVRH